MEAIRPSRNDHVLFTENSLIHVRKFCTLKPPLGHDSATEDISATFSMLVSRDFSHAYSQ